MTLGALVLSWSTFTMMVAPVAPSDDVAADIAAGESAWQQGRWSDASEAFARVYAQTKEPRYLYARAQVERLGGRCEVAIALYQEFVDTDPAESQRKAALGFMQMCRDALGSTEPESNDAEPESNDAEPESNDAEPESSVPPSDDLPGDSAPSGWARDRWGWGLAGSGLAFSAAGATLLGVGFAAADQAESAPDDRAFGIELDRARTLAVSGGVALGVGATLLIAGIIRWAVVGRRARRTAGLARPPRGWAMPSLPR